MDDYSDIPNVMMAEVSGRLVRGEIAAPSGHDLSDSNGVRKAAAYLCRAALAESSERAREKTILKSIDDMPGETFSFVQEPVIETTTAEIKRKPGRPRKTETPTE